MPKEVDKPLLEVLHSGYIGQGSRVALFEKKLSEYLDNNNVITVNSGTSALHLALRLAGVTYGDDVISTAMTCSATNEPILANGGNIIWADVYPENGLIDPLSVERKITPKTKAIVCVDWGGTVCDLDKLMQIAKKHNIKLIEDAAHGFGSKYNGKKVGSIADFTCFSFQAIKHITTVDGGLLTTKSKKDYQRGKLLRWYGIDRELEIEGDSRIDIDIPEWGYKFHMNDVSATIGLVQLEFINKILKSHQKNAKYFLDNIDNEYFQHPVTTWEQESSYWIYTLVLPSPEERLEFASYMKKNGVATSRVHRRNDTYSGFVKSKDILCGLSYFYDREECIPVHWGLTANELQKIVTLCNNFSKSH